MQKGGTLVVDEGAARLPGSAASAEGRGAVAAARAGARRGAGASAAAAAPTTATTTAGGRRLGLAAGRGTTATGALLATGAVAATAATAAARAVATAAAGAGALGLAGNLDDEAAGHRDPLAGGELVAMMPEGTIPRGAAFFDPVLKGRWGAAKLAAMTGAPVIPVGMWGTEKVWPRSERLPNLLNVRNPPSIAIQVGKPVAGLLGGEHGGAGESVADHAVVQGQGHHLADVGRDRVQLGGVGQPVEVGAAGMDGSAEQSMSGDLVVDAQ